MTPTPITAEVIYELRRCLDAMEAYRQHPGDWRTSRTHAAASRASLDLTRLLARWRQTPTLLAKEGAPK